MIITVLFPLKENIDLSCRWHWQSLGACSGSSRAHSIEWTTDQNSLRGNKKSKIKHEKQRSSQSPDNAAFTLWCGRPSHRWQKLTLVPYNSWFIIGVMPSISEAGICVASLVSTLWEQVCCTALIFQKRKNFCKGKTGLNNLVKCM